MKRLIQKIQIWDFVTKSLKLEFPTITDVSIETSRLNFTDTADVYFVERVYDQNKKISDLINRGDRIVIQLGYFDTGLINEFDGYVTEIIPTSPVQLKCQDEMYLLKQQTLETKVFKNVNLKELVTYYYKGNTVILNAPIGIWVVGHNSTIVDLFDELKQKLGILTYFQDKILFCNAELIKEPEKIITFNVNENVPLDSDQFQTDKQGNFNLVVHGLSPQKNGTKIERFAYYKDITRQEIVIISDKPDGVLNLVKVGNITQSKLDELITQRLPKLYEGTTSGEIQTFGSPTFKHGDRAKVINSSNPSNDGTYDILGITKTFSVSDGYKQNAKTGLKIE